MIWLFPAGAHSPWQEDHRLKTVVIDPGHGGKDPGTVVSGVKEKDIVLDVGLRLGEKIKNMYPGLNVVYTRSADVFIPLYARADIANRNKADLFISIHANYVSVSSIRGSETYTLGLHRSQENLEVAKKENSVILLEEDYTTNYEGFNPNETESYIMFENLQAEYQTQSIDFAARVQDEFTKNLKISNRGVRQAGFLVIRETTMPSALIEVGFISNPAERKFLVTADGKEKVAESIFLAFTEYKKNIDTKSMFNASVAEVIGKEPARSKTTGTQNKIQNSSKKSETSTKDSVDKVTSGQVNITQAAQIRNNSNSTASGKAAALPGDSTAVSITKEEAQKYISPSARTTPTAKDTTGIARTAEPLNKTINPAGRSVTVSKDTIKVSKENDQAKKTMIPSVKTASNIRDSAAFARTNEPAKKSVNLTEKSSKPDKQEEVTMERYYSVQIGAVGNALEPVPSNFKGEKNVFRIRIQPYYKFYIGKFATIPEALKERTRLQSEFPGAFPVVIENNLSRPLKKEEIP